jgi:hypothetical protein
MIATRNVLRLLFVVALFTVVVSLAVVTPASAAKLCCLDEWQGGGVCPAGQRLASQCGPGCQSCGVFTCVPESTLCLR